MDTVGVYTNRCLPHSLPWYDHNNATVLEEQSCKSSWLELILFERETWSIRLTQFLPTALPAPAVSLGIPTSETTLICKCWRTSFSYFLPRGPVPPPPPLNMSSCSSPLSYFHFLLPKEIIYQSGCVCRPVWCHGWVTKHSNQWQQPEDKGRILPWRQGKIKTFNYKQE